MKTLKPFALILLLCAAFLPAIAIANDDPAKTLEDAGLTKTGLEYIIQQEAEIIKARREIHAAQKELTDAEKDFRTAEKKIAKAQAYIANLQKEADALESRRLRADTQNKYARIVESIREIQKQIQSAQEERKKFEKDQQLKLDNTRAEYIATMVVWVEKAQVVIDAYKKLSEDKAITDAITQVSKQDKRKYVLGPSRRFAMIQKELAKAAAEYQRGAVDLRKAGNVMEIDVRINGKPIRTMILDTGASALSLPHQFAKDLGIEVSDTDPIVQLQMADGKLVDAKKVSLDSVQVGEFICNDIEAFVLPEHLSAASPLLGNSFLSNFTYEIDPDRLKLILSRLKKQEG